MCSHAHHVFSSELKWIYLKICLWPPKSVPASVASHIKKCIFSTHTQMLWAPSLPSASSHPPHSPRPEAREEDIWSRLKRTWLFRYWPAEASLFWPFWELRTPNINWSLYMSQESHLRSAVGFFNCSFLLRGALSLCWSSDNDRLDFSAETQNSFYPGILFCLLKCYMALAR